LNRHLPPPPSSLCRRSGDAFVGHRTTANVDVSTQDNNVGNTFGLWGLRTNFMCWADTVFSPAEDGDYTIRITGTWCALLSSTAEG